VLDSWVVSCNYVASVPDLIIPAVLRMRRGCRSCASLATIVIEPFKLLRAFYSWLCRDLVSRCMVRSGWLARMRFFRPGLQEYGCIACASMRHMIKLDLTSIQHVLGRISFVDAHRCARMGQGGRELILARRAFYCSPCCCHRIRIMVRSAFAFAHARVQVSGTSDCVHDSCRSSKYGRKCVSMRACTRPAVQKHDRMECVSLGLITKIVLGQIYCV
jgi:hypothetical protein